MAEWRNRIVGHGEKPASEFVASPFNLDPKLLPRVRYNDGR